MQRASGHTLSEASENYLKAIFELSGTDQASRVSTSELARHFEVAPASVTGMLKKLAAATPSTIEYRPRQGVSLTALGRKIALEVIRHHRLIELYLHEALGYGWDEVHDEAERLEHVISEDFEDRVAALLGDPEYDPHGAPIPRKDGSFPALRGVAIASLSPGTRGRVVRVDDEDPAFLRYLANLGLIPGAILQVESREPFDGPITVQVDQEKTRSTGKPAQQQQQQQHALGSRVSNRVFVERLDAR
jgi:DtxR family Mn-dependent transcriptional regulator